MFRNLIRAEDSAQYTAASKADDNAINRALKCLELQLKGKDLYPTVDAFTNPDIVKNYLTLQLALEEREHFHVLFLNNQHKLLLNDRMFSGTIDGSSVYPREVVKLALQTNAAAVIFAHNHPSGVCEPSVADRDITSKLKQGLEMFDIRVLDHIIVGNTSTYSFAEHGLI